MSHRFPVVSALLPIALLPLALLPLALLSLLIWVGSSVPAVAQALPSGAGVDLNTADAATLARELQGIGESRARAIVEHRRRHGPFRSVDELALVRGIGPNTVERNRSRLRIGAVAAPAGDG
ncbi:MAG: ComEA family DNA-binding protein, partial [Gammaproteobacteria bacterium]